VKDVAVLESVRTVARDFGIPTAELKPCIAFLLDGNIGGASRHKAAFVLAIDLRRLGWNEEQVGKALRRWARSIGYRGTDRAIRSAFKRDSRGNFCYRPPGLTKTSPTYAEVLKPLCDEIGCPANCPAFSGVYQGLRSETFERFDRLGWPVYLKKKRQATLVDVYQAICRIERERDLASGGQVITTYRQIAAHAGRDFSNIGKNLTALYDWGCSPNSNWAEAAAQRRAIVNRPGSVAVSRSRHRAQGGPLPPQ
jgi:hypothetical protein